MLSCREQVETSLVIAVLAGLFSASGPESATARTMSRSEMMPSTVLPSPLTTSAPILRLDNSPATAVRVASGFVVATSLPLVFRIISTFMVVPPSAPLRGSISRIPRYKPGGRNTAERHLG